MTIDEKGALSDLRVVDFGSPSTLFATRLWADLGADVVIVEPPSGCKLRLRPPFWGNQDIERGLAFHALARNKRGVVADPDSARDLALVRGLVARADVVFTDCKHSDAPFPGIDYASAQRQNDRLIWVSLSPFGSTGPHSHFRASELTVQAMAGALALTGQPGERPVWAGGHVAEKMAGYTAAMAAMFAVLQRSRTRSGQFIDISMQEAVSAQMEAFSTSYRLDGSVGTRGGRLYPRTYPAGLFPAADGWVGLVAGPLHQWISLVEWIDDDRLREKRFEDLDTRMRERPYLDSIICQWSRRHNKNELMREGQRRKIPVGVSQTSSEVVADEQLRAQDYFVELEREDLGRFVSPGPSFSMSRTPVRITRPAPRLGEHTAELLAELGLN